ncbi:MAG: hypothetical protein ACI9FJ_001572 [Alteromonadaceae bacterium]
MVYLDICVGTVIKPYWILTAAHCANLVTQLPLHIRHLGKKHPVGQIIAYPDADKGEDQFSLLIWQYRGADYKQWLKLLMDMRQRAIFNCVNYCLNWALNEKFTPKLSTLL